ncbi:MAG: hypothetical protein M0Z28_32980 [Rhodospirillales bacterium]|nr:hypothetical protein [Rhodospirillales bacterium]
MTGFEARKVTDIGPRPTCAMLLADFGATELRIDRTVPRRPE